MAKHTKGDKEGVKKERPNLRIVRMSQFRQIADIPTLYMALFGAGVVDSDSNQVTAASFLDKE